MEIETVKNMYAADNEHIGYIVNGVHGVPLVEGNKEYRKIQAWIDAGNTPEE